LVVLDAKAATMLKMEKMERHALEVAIEMCEHYADDARVSDLLIGLFCSGID
jgi:hypothetical protein